MRLLFVKVNGLVFPPDDARALADCIARVGTDGQLRAQLCRAGRETVESEFDLSRMVGDLETYLKTVVERGD